MSIFVVPSIKRPQLYFSNDRNVVNYFINNFLYSRNVNIQLMISIIRFLFPDKLVYIVFNIFLTKITELPNELSEDLNIIKRFVKANKESFKSYPDNHNTFNFIIRKSAWKRKEDKFVIILFCAYSKKPFAIAKVGGSGHKSSFEEEYKATNSLFNKFNLFDLVSIPEPIATYHDHDKSIYFEKVIDGIPFNSFLKLIPNLKKKQDYFITVLTRYKDFLIQCAYEKEQLTSEAFVKYFYKPIDDFSNTDPGLRYIHKLNELKEEARTIQQTSLYSVWMHGDLWGGSILYNKNKIGIIDWEFFTERGVPLWDFFSLVFHAGTEIYKGNMTELSDFLTYFKNIEISQKVDTFLIKLASFYHIDIKHISFLFQTYLLFNIQSRDSETEKHWQYCLEYYWNLSLTKTDAHTRLL